MLSLLVRRRFGPLFATQFAGAFNDNFYKTAMLFLIGYHILADSPEQASVLMSLASGVFILPFLLFSGLAGQLADRHDKTKLVRLIKVAEIGIMAVGAAALLGQSIPLLMAVLFAMGLHSTFFGPIKYAILPQHVRERELLAATGLVEAGTYLAILGGQLVGGLLAPQHAAIGVLAVAAVGVLASLPIPPAPPAADRSRPSYNLIASTTHLLSELLRDRTLLRTVITISWFWALGAVLTSQFVPLVQGSLGAAQSVATLFLIMFSIGIAAGSLAVNRLLKGAVSARLAPGAGLAMSLVLLDLYFAIHGWPAHDGPAGIAQMLRAPEGWRILLDLLLLSAASGIFVVPLYAILQTAVPPAQRARTIAANNVVNSLFMVAASLGAAGLVGGGLPIVGLFLVLSALNLPVVALSARLRVLAPAA